MKLLLEIAYCGKGFHGWQVQPGCRTVQQTMQECCEKLLAQPCGITGCSRTDSGVHALRYFCTVTTPAPVGIPFDKLPIALNAILPDDLSVSAARLVEDAFHPRYCAIGKTYEYHIRENPIPDPFSAGLVWQYGRALRLEEMQVAAGYFIGSHDFTSFCAAASDTEDKIRRIYSLELRREGDLVILCIEGNGFLYNMVRIITGTLVGVSEGRFVPGDMPAILYAGNRAAAGLTAPAAGLYLRDVCYPV